MNIFFKIKVRVIGFISKIKVWINKVRAFFMFIKDYLNEEIGR